MRSQTKALGCEDSLSTSQLHGTLCPTSVMPRLQLLPLSVCLAVHPQMRVMTVLVLLLRRHHEDQATDVRQLAIPR